jgi:hypothetical protein
LQQCRNGKRSSVKNLGVFPIHVRLNHKRVSCLANTIISVMKSFLCRASSPLRCRRSVKDIIDEINEKEAQMMEGLAKHDKVNDLQDLSPGTAKQRAGRYRDRDRSRSLTRFARSNSRKKDSDGSSIFKESSNDEVNVTQNLSNETPTRGRSKSVTRFIRSVSRSRLKENEDSSMPRERITVKANDGHNLTSRPIERSASLSRGRSHSVTRFLRSSSTKMKENKLNNDEKNHSKREAVERNVESERDDTSDVQSVLKEVEKHLKLAKSQGSSVNRATFLKALNCVMDSLGNETKSYDGTVQSQESDRWRDDSSYTQRSQAYSLPSKSSVFSDYDHDHADTSSYLDEERSNFLAEFFSESDSSYYHTYDNDTLSFLSSHVNDGMKDTGSFDETNDDSTFDSRADTDSHGDYESSSDDSTDEESRAFNESVSSSVATVDGSRIGRSTFGITPSSFKDIGEIFHSWGAKSEQDQSKMQRNVEGQQLQGSANSKLFSGSEIYANDRFRSLSPRGKDNLTDLQRDEASCNPIDVTSWMKVEDATLSKMLNDFFWLGSSSDVEARSKTPPPRPKRFNVRNRELIQENGVAGLKPIFKHTNDWPTPTPTEASFSPSNGNSPDRGSVEIIRQEDSRSAKPWFRRKKTDNSKPSTEETGIDYFSIRNQNSARNPSRNGKPLVGGIRVIES